MFNVALVVSWFIMESIAQTTLFIPGFDPQPLSVSFLGVDSISSHTTFLVSPATPTGSEDPSGLESPFTLVESPTDASETILLGSNIIYESCAFSTGGGGVVSAVVASCFLSVSGVDVGTAVSSVRETVVPFVVQGGSVSASGTRSGSGNASVSASLTSSSISAPTITAQNSSNFNSNTNTNTIPIQTSPSPSNTPAPTTTTSNPASRLTSNPILILLSSLSLSLSLSN